MVKIDEFDDNILGVRFWMLIAQHKTQVPRFEVFRYIGRNKMGDLFFFQSVRTLAHISMRADELYSDYFKPFLIDHKKMAKEIKKVDESYNF